MNFQDSHSRDLVIDFDVKDLISDLESLSQTRSDNFIDALQDFLDKYKGKAFILVLMNRYQGRMHTKLRSLIFLHLK